MSAWLNRTHVGDCRDLLRQMAADGVQVQTCVTSPPYYGLRDYGVAGQIGLEPSLYDWIDTMVEVFDLVREILREDGVLWLNLGDAYASNGGAGWQGENGQRADRRFTATRNTVAMREATRRPPAGLKAKDLMGQPWRVAFALQDAGWYLRSDVIWAKPNPMPESVRDRPTKAHEYVFMLTRSKRYHYDQDATREPASPNTHARMAQNIAGQAGSTRANGGARADRPMKAVAGKGAQGRKFAAPEVVLDRNMRTVWTIPPEAFKGAHFATFPRNLVRRCILASTKPGDTVLDPFMGSGTVAQVATDLGRQFIGCELNPAYVELHHLRRTTIGMAV